jgi:uncharacterized protein (TIGR00730 family)
MNICVFCGSATGNVPLYADAAKRLGTLMAQGSHTLIYGGGNVGLMGVLADSILENQGEVVGIIPEFLMMREVGHRGVTRLEVVQTMHERKQRMADLANAFVALPGGWGTLDELAEILTWRQLGIIQQHFFDPLLEQMRRMADDGFLKAANLEKVIIRDQPETLLEAIIPQ